MDITAVKNFLGACHEAKRITELMPELPKGMTPRHIQVLDVIWQMEAAGQSVKVSDISDFLNVTRPSITKLIRELEGFGAVVKLQDGADRRSRQDKPDRPRPAVLRVLCGKISELAGGKVFRH